MRITDHQVHKIAHLAKLDLDGLTVSTVAQQLENILALIEQMNLVDTSKVAPSFHSIETFLPLRPDQVTKKNQREAFQEIAPLVEAGLYLVPKVIE